VSIINPDLTGTLDITIARRLPENFGIAFEGDKKAGPFEIDGTLALRWLSLPTNPNGRPNSDVVRPWTNGADISGRHRDMWIVDFGVDMTEHEAAMYEAPFEYVVQHVRPERVRNADRGSRELWWIHQRPRPVMRAAVAGLLRFICTVRHSKFRLFVWFDPRTVPDSALVVFARDDDYFFGVLHSRAHEVWSLRMGTWLGVGNDPRYTPTTCFETFPFPRPDDAQRAEIAAAAQALDALRRNWLNPPDADAAELKQRTLTNLYNQRPSWLAHAHARLDRAVWAAYGWDDDPDPATTPEDAILSRLLALNLDRADAAARVLET
jgi:type II restriction/modification system DNA methylase subunit YeeA